MKTDLQLQKDIQEELEWEPAVHSTQIGVEVSDGVVTLSGQVGSSVEKWHAEKATQRVSGVKALAVKIKVALEGDSRRTDTDIARAAEHVLMWSSSVPRESVKVLVEDGWVTLSGEVDWNFQRQAATAVVRHLLGVTGVSDQIGIKPKVSAGVIRSDIEASLKRRAHMDAEAIQVAVDGNKITLSGKVHSWPERELAWHAAWGAPGVVSVLNNIVIAP